MLSESSAPPLPPLVWYPSLLPKLELDCDGEPTPPGFACAARSASVRA